MSKTKAVNVPKMGKHEKRERLMGYLLAAPAVVLLPGDILLDRKSVV